jgi:signal transduction histidine kinase
MSWGPLTRSLQAKLLVAVIACALVPLAAVGMWLSSSAVRSGELLLRAQLDSTASRSAAAIRQRWVLRRSDVLMLATSAPIRMSLQQASADTAPTYARRAFASMSGISSVSLIDGANRVRWTIGESPLIARVGSDSRRDGAGLEEASPILLRAPVSNDAERPIGTVEARLRLDAVVPGIQMIEAAPSQFAAYRDRSSGAEIAPANLPEAAFESDHFEWNDHRWFAVKQRMTDPPIDVLVAAQSEPFLSPFTRTARIGALALTLAAAVVVVLTMFVTSVLTRSLGELAVAADRVSRGALDARVQVTSEDEVGRVGRAFNGMLENIARMMRELSQREAVTAMGEMAATMAHQLRSPATAIRLDVQRAHDKLGAETPERALLARALGQLDRLERAVSASLKVARAGRTEFTVIDIREPLERAAAGVRGVDMTVVPRNPVHIRGDAAALEQLFANVLTNAAQASPNGRRTTVSMSADEPEMVSVTISDQGIGMSPDVLARAGEPLFSTKPEGTGLGLAIARRIAAAHGGTLSIASERGRGTSVTVRLPSAAISEGQGGGADPVERR